MPKKKKRKKDRVKVLKQKKTCLPARFARLPASQGESARPRAARRAGKVKIIEPELMLERELALEDRDLQKAKVGEILEGFRKDRDKRREQLKGFMDDLRMQRAKRKQEMQKYMQNIRSQVLAQKRMVPEVRI